MIGNKIFQTEEEREYFIELFADPDRYGKSINDIADTFRCSVSTIHKTLKDENIKREIKDKRRSFISTELPKVDHALLREALTGNVKAIELFYMRWDDFSKSLNLTQNIEISQDQIEDRRRRTREFLDKFLPKPPEPAPMIQELLELKKGRNDVLKAQTLLEDKDANP